MSRKKSCVGGSPSAIAERRFQRPTNELEAQIMAAFEALDNAIAKQLIPTIDVCFMKPGFELKQRVGQ